MFGGAICHNEKLQKGCYYIAVFVNLNSASQLSNVC